MSQPAQITGHNAQGQQSEHASQIHHPSPKPLSLHTASKITLRPYNESTPGHSQFMPWCAPLQCYAWLGLTCSNLPCTCIQAQRHIMFSTYLRHKAHKQKSLCIQCCKHVYPHPGDTWVHQHRYTYIHSRSTRHTMSYHHIVLSRPTSVLILMARVTDLVLDATVATSAMQHLSSGNYRLNGVIASASVTPTVSCSQLSVLQQDHLTLPTQLSKLRMRLMQPRK